MLHVTIRPVVTIVIVGWMKDLGDGAATALPIVSIVSTVSTATTVSKGERESDCWTSATTKTQQQEPG